MKLYELYLMVVWCFIGFCWGKDHEIRKSIKYAKEIKKSDFVLRAALRYIKECEQSRS